jgi:hypothetical protein
VSRSRLGGCCAAAVLIIASGSRQTVAYAQDSSVRAIPSDPVDVIRDAFTRHRLVGLGEVHRLREQHDFIRRVVADDRLAGVMQDVVVEFGNAGYQAIVDAYIAGEPVPLDSVREAWRNTTTVALWDAPSYERLFTTVRELNRARPPAARLRILLGDPPIRWDTLRTASQAFDWLENASRNVFYADVVEREVLAKGRRALLISGGGHLMRLAPARRRDFPDGGPSATAYLEHRHPGVIFVIGVDDPTGPRPDRERTRLGWPRPSIARLDGTELGSAKERDATLGVLWDAWLYLGPAATLHLEGAPDSLYGPSSPYGKEVRRRVRLLQEAGVMPKQGERGLR